MKIVLILACAMIGCASQHVDVTTPAANNIKKIDEHGHGHSLSDTAVESRVLEIAFNTSWRDAMYVPSAGDSAAPALAFLEARLKALNVTLNYAEIPGGGMGRTDRDHWIIWVNSTLEPNGRLETLAHEAGHLFQPPTFNVVEAQAFAELVGAVVCARLGFDITHNSGRYLGSFKQGIAAAIAARVDREYAVKMLTEEDIEGVH